MWRRNCCSRCMIKGIQTMDTSSDIRQRWLDEEGLVSSRMGEVGVVSPDQLNSFGGLEFWKLALQGTVPAPPITRTLGFVPISVARGEAIFQGTPRFEHYNPLGIVHGGYFFTLLDSAAGCAVHTTLPAGTGVTALGGEDQLHPPVSDAPAPRPWLGAWSPPS